MSASQQAIQNSMLPVKKVGMQSQLEPSKVNPDGFTNTPSAPVSKFGENGHGIRKYPINSKIVPTGFF